MNTAGIDGCKGGWIIAKNIAGKYSINIHENFATLMADNQHLDRILIDMPIGLSSEKYARTIESKMRAELGNRSSTVFNAPCRLAVYEANNEKAKRLNEAIEKKSLSIQSLNIRAKIKEVDQYLCKKIGPTEIIESHPELCFKYLNQEIVQSKKSKPEGLAERLAIIEKYDPKLIKLYEASEKRFMRKLAQKDDIIDAICLCLVNQLGVDEQLSYLIDENKIDEKGISMKIAYYESSLTL